MPNTTDDDGDFTASGCRNWRQLQDEANAADETMTDEEAAEIEKLRRKNFPEAFKK